LAVSVKDKYYQPGQLIQLDSFGSLYFCSLSFLSVQSISSIPYCTN